MDRTAEFRTALETALLQQPVGIDGGLNNNKNTKKNDHGKLKSKEARQEFAQLTRVTVQRYTATMGRLKKLVQLAQRMTLFDDRPEQFNELTYMIKQDFATMQQNLAKLQRMLDVDLAARNTGKQVAEHHSNVIGILTTQVANANNDLQHVLEARTQKMRASQSHREQLDSGTTGGLGLGAQGPSQRHADPGVDSGLASSSTKGSTRQAALGSDTDFLGGESVLAAGPLSTRGKGKRSHRHPHQAAAAIAAANAVANGTSKDPYGAGHMDDDHLSLNLGGAEKQRQQQLQSQQLQEFVDQQDSYLQQRGTAIESIESTIQELGQMFGQLATIVAQQGETITRIDMDTEEISQNVNSAQRELIKYYQSVTSNRSLMLKVFGILIAFFFLLVMLS